MSTDVNATASGCPAPSRREAIRLGLAALGAMGVSALAPATATAATGTMQYGAPNDAGGDETSLESSSPWSNGATLTLLNSSTTGTALWSSVKSAYPTAMFVNQGVGASVRADTTGGGYAGDFQVVGQAGYGVSAVLISSGAVGTAVRGKVVNGSGIALQGLVELGTATAVVATNKGTGGAVKAEITNPASTASAVTATTNGKAQAVSATSSGASNAIKAEITNPANASTAVLASTAGTGSAVWGLSSGVDGAVKATNIGKTGYGIEVGGGKAQVFVVPASTSGAPTTGVHKLGEHFTDSAGREYVCTSAGTPGIWQPTLRGGTNTTALTVKSYSPSAPAIKAQASASSGAALRVEGKMTMTRSGRARVAKGNTSVDVTVPGGLTAYSNIICTAQNSGGSGVYIRYAKRISTTQFQIKLNKAAAYNLYVAWMVLG